MANLKNPADVFGQWGGMPSGGAPAGMSIHKAEGLVPINAHGESNIPGLYASGDALGSYMAGAIYTQVGSSLAGSAVQGAIAAKAAALYAKGIKTPTITQKKQKNNSGRDLGAPEKGTGIQPCVGNTNPSRHHDSEFCSLHKESRCSHYRLDSPEPDTKNWNAWINIYKGDDNEMKLEKQPFGSWPVCEPG